MAIRVTPEELDSMASQLSSLASEASALAKSVESAINAGAANWEGNAAAKYQQEYAKLKPVLATQLPQLLTDFSTEAKSRAEAYRSADR